MEDAIGAFNHLLESSVSWEVELTSRCNSRCVGCSRLSEYYYPNPYFKNNVDLPKELLFKALAAPKKVDFILFCGNYGDPLLHPDIFEIMEHIRTHYGTLRVLVHSNASFGNEDFWKQLAGYFSTPGSYVKFSLDGFKKSHESFRRGTNWDRALKNAEIFIQAGGRAVWKAIEFDHNRDELKELESFAKEKGFLKFDQRKNNYPGLDGPVVVDVDLKKIPPLVTDDQRSYQHLKAWSDSQFREKKYDHIECKSLLRKNVFLDSHGQVWPCCWVGGLPYRPEHELRQWFHEKVLNKYGPGFNSLVHHSVEEIFSKSWMKEDLEKSWSNSAADPQNPLLSTCAKSCGKCQVA